MRQFNGNNPAQQESSTTVHLLVKELNKVPIIIKTFHCYRIKISILHINLCGSIKSVRQKNKNVECDFNIP